MYSSYVDTCDGESDPSFGEGSGRVQHIGEEEPAYVECSIAAGTQRVRYGAGDTERGYSSASRYSNEDTGRRLRRGCSASTSERSARGFLPDGGGGGPVSAVGDAPISSDGQLAATAE